MVISLNDRVTDPRRAALAKRAAECRHATGNESERKTRVNAERCLHPLSCKVFARDPARSPIRLSRES